MRDTLANAFLATGGSQCGFCTPGIVMRAAGMLAKGKTSRVELDRALAAHLCRCTGWQSVYEAIEGGVWFPHVASRRPDAAMRRAELEGGVAQRIGASIPLGDGGFADDLAPVTRWSRCRGHRAPPPNPWKRAVTTGWSGARSRTRGPERARCRAGARPSRPRRRSRSRPVRRGVRLATSWVEPAYLEPDASWCEPGGTPASPLANGGAFGGKASSPVAAVARELADSLGRPVRVVYSREDVVRLGPKRPPIAATARYVDGVVVDRRHRRRRCRPFMAPIDWPYRIEETTDWKRADVPGPPTASHLRAVGRAERAVLVEGALAEAGVDRPRRPRP